MIAVNFEVGLVARNTSIIILGFSMQNVLYGNVNAIVAAQSLMYVLCNLTRCVNVTLLFNF